MFLTFLVNPFGEYLIAIADIIKYIFYIGFACSLGMHLYQIYKGDEEAVGQLKRWIVVFAVGSILISIISKLGS